MADESRRVEDGPVDDDRGREVPALDETRHHGEARRRVERREDAEQQRRRDDDGREEIGKREQPEPGARLGQFPGQSAKRDALRPATDQRKGCSERENQLIPVPERGNHGGIGEAGHDAADLLDAWNR